MIFPDLTFGEKLKEKRKRLLIAAYGFEERSLGWTEYEKNLDGVLQTALIIRYEPAKAPNRMDELRGNLNSLGIDYPDELKINFLNPEEIEESFEKKLKNINDYDEIVFDITAMTKFLILVGLCKLIDFKGILRIVYSEAKDYSPTIEEYKKYKNDSKEIAHFPSQGFKKILRSKCLSSIRMQGQPVALIAFASFNEQLIRHMLGTISPYRLIFINGTPPRGEYKWREKATQEIHKKLIDDYRSSNDIDLKSGLLVRSTSTLNYKETIDSINDLYKKYGLYERIIIAATGSKMQTIGLFFSKMIHPDIHIEYPTPDSYFFKGMSLGIAKIHEIKIPSFNSFINDLKTQY